MHLFGILVKYCAVVWVCNSRNACFDHVDEYPTIFDGLIKYNWNDTFGKKLKMFLLIYRNKNWKQTWVSHRENSNLLTLDLFEMSKWRLLHFSNRHDRFHLIKTFKNSTDSYFLALCINNLSSAHKQIICLVVP